MLSVVLAAVLSAGGSGTPPSLTAFEFVSVVSLDFPSINSGATAVLTGTISGAEVGDHVTVARCSSLSVDISDMEPRISASNTVSLQVRNFNEVDAVNPDPCAFVFKVTKQ